MSGTRIGILWKICFTKGTAKLVAAHYAEQFLYRMVETNVVSNLVTVLAGESRLARKTITVEERAMERAAILGLRVS